MNNRIKLIFELHRYLMKTKKLLSRLGRELEEFWKTATEEERDQFSANAEEWEQGKKVKQ